MTDAPDNRFSFSTLLDAMPDAIVIVDTEGRIVEVNVHTVGLFGHPRSALIGQPVEMLIPEEFRRAHVGERAKYVQNPHVRPMGLGLELKGLKKDGQTFPVEISLAPYHSPQGPLVVAAIRDVSARRRA
jgi:PAS domain S-box-containing protein